MVLPFALVLFVQAPVEPDSPRAAAAELFRSRCQACHVTPDPRFAVERAWIAQIANTVCSKTPPDSRSALVEYLESQPLPLPEVVDASRAPAGGLATLLPNFRSGAALLRAADGRLVRVSWDEPSTERKRWVAPGRYELLGFRLVAEAEGATWALCGSGLGGLTLDFAPGGTHVLALEALIRLEERVAADGLEVALRGHEEAGVSIYKDGKRVPLRYRRLGPDGALLAEGELEFGSEGSSAARYERVAGERAPEVVLEPLPFPVRRVRR